mmetsp:Transcript_3951/g.11143  ORF Transcript_3951/g.11143 Transcript_3951/m.11143 type:complete len:277 (-) Transcript_3951:14-844(-)
MSVVGDGVAQKVLGASGGLAWNDGGGGIVAAVVIVNDGVVRLLDSLCHVQGQFSNNEWILTERFVNARPFWFPRNAQQGRKQPIESCAARVLTRENPRHARMLPVEGRCQVDGLRSDEATVDVVRAMHAVQTPDDGRLAVLLCRALYHGHRLAEILRVPREVAGWHVEHRANRELADVMVHQVLAERSLVFVYHQIDVNLRQLPDLGLERHGFQELFDVLGARRHCSRHICPFPLADFPSFEWWIASVSVYDSDNRERVWICFVCSILIPWLLVCL